MNSKQVSEIVRWFGLEHSKPQEEIAMEIPPLTAGQIMLLTGPSGAGKSRLLARIKSEWAKGRNGEPAIGRWIDLADLELPRRAVVDCFPRQPLEQTLLRLNQVGLAEAWDYIRSPASLSEGQKFRLRLAVGLARLGEKGPRPGRRPSGRRISVLACDEFCAILDRVTARVVARTLRKTMDHCKDVCVIVATSHDDLAEALRPDVILRCDFGKAEIMELNH